MGSWPEARVTESSSPVRGSTDASSPDFRRRLRNLWIDTLRGVAAIWVVLFHLNEVIPYEASMYRSFVRYGWLGVPIFFVISGYCIRLTVERSTSAGAFLLRRLVRIWPPYVASLAVVVGVAVMRRLVSGYNDVTVLPRGLVAWTETLFLFTAPATKLPTINWVYWSLTLEVTFYIVVAVSRLREAFELSVVSVACVAAFSATLRRMPVLFFLPWWPVFAIGIAVFELRTNQTALKWALLASSVSATAYVQGEIVATTAALTAAIIAVSETRFLSMRPPRSLVHIGRCSYSLYLLHVPIGVYVLLRFRHGVLLASLPAHIMYDIAAVAGCVGVSLVFFKLVEVPAIKASQVVTR